MQPLKSSQTQTDRQTQTDADGNVHRHRSSNSSLDLFYFHRVRVFAPFTPFLTEHMYQNLKHLVDWSKKEEETNKRSVHAFTEQFYRSNLQIYLYFLRL